MSSIPGDSNEGPLFAGLPSVCGFGGGFTAPGGLVVYDALTPPGLKKIKIKMELTTMV